jgi:ABC-type antimicrobial peptide transport system permease subunit
VRIAVGATPRSVRGLLLRQSLVPMAIGGVAGIAAAALFGRYLEPLISGAEATSAAVAAAAIALGLAAALAVWMATARIVRMDPAAALRAE